MRKDIEIPSVEGVYIVAVPSSEEANESLEWHVYLINELDEPLEMVMIVSKGANQSHKTSVMRHRLEKLPPKSYAKVERIDASVFSLNNYYAVSFFKGSTLYDKVYEFPAHSIDKRHLEPVPVMNQDGIISK